MREVYAASEVATESGDAQLVSSSPLTVSISEYLFFLVVKLKKVQPTMIEERLDGRMLPQYLVDRSPWRLDEYTQAKRRVHPIRTIVKGLHRQANPKIAAVAFEDAQMSTHNIMQDLVPTAVVKDALANGSLVEVEQLPHLHETL